MARLLLLDDEPEALEWMTAALATLGHEVRGFRSGREALAKMSEWHPDLVVSDLLMPEMDGLAFSRLVHAHGGPPVLFISIAMMELNAWPVALTPTRFSTASAPSISIARAKVKTLLIDWIENSLRENPTS